MSERDRENAPQNIVRRRIMVCIPIHFISEFHHFFFFLIFAFSIKHVNINIVFFFKFEFMSKLIMLFLFFLYFYVVVYAIDTLNCYILKYDV